MARGIAAFVFVTSLIFSMSILGGLGFYASMGVEVDASTHSADAERAADSLDGIEFGEGRSSSILEGPLAVVTPVVDVLNTFVTVLDNTSGVLQLLYGLPPVVADTIQSMFRIAMLVTLAFMVRGLMQ